MQNTQTMLLAPAIERARKILQHEQRTNHQDVAIKPGGLEAFIARWYEETSTICKNAGLDLSIIHRFVEHLEGYHQHDQLTRAECLRTALMILNELDGHNPTNAPSLANKINQDKKDASADRPLPPPVELADLQPASGLEIPEPIPLDVGMTAGHTSLALLSADVTAVPGVGPAVAKRLNHLGIRTIRDLLFYFPREHRDYSKLTKIAQIPFDEVTTTMGLLWEVRNQKTSTGKMRTIADISDETGKISISWFNQGYLQKQLQTAKGEYLVVTGIKKRFGNKVEFSVRSHELPERGDLLNTGRLVPIYPLTEGLHAKSMLRFTKFVVDRYAQMIPEHLPRAIRAAGQLLPLPDAVIHMHYPDNEQKRLAAHRRLAFDELFLIQLGMQERRARWQQQTTQGNPFTIHYHRIFIDPPVKIIRPTNDDQRNSSCNNQDGAINCPDAMNRVPMETRDKSHKKSEHLSSISSDSHSTSEMMPIGSTLWSLMATDKPFEATLPFSFTAAQRRVICEIFADLAQNKPMCRLLQGDVGAGKTAVAAAALLMAALNGYQGAIMAPTELLAEQHARGISAMLEPFGIRTVLLTGSMRQRERQNGRTELETGQASIAIGTHALIQEDVIFQKLGLVIIDEQHRFGVEQRDALRQKGHHPHMLVMTATPIPRTLALTLYGDLDISIIDQLPPGRQKIITRWRVGTKRNEAYTAISKQIAEGRQAFIICPLIEESETIEAKAAVSEYERLQREVFPKLRLGLLHGGMKPAEKDQVMRSFRDRELDVLVATSVIEVGIDIPNATVMVIEDADRFGLSQLHQFRGRVGRGKHQSYCYVLSADARQQAQERLGVFQDTDDGFRLAEEDLRLRGPGDFIGIRQSGTPELKVATLDDTKLIEFAKQQAIEVWENDPKLQKNEHAALREKLRLFWRNFVAH